MENEKLDPEQTYKTTMVVWFALLMSQFMFLFMIFVVRSELFRFDFSGPLLGENPLVVFVAAAVSITTLILSFVLKKKFLTQAVTEQKVGLVQTATIVGCALAEVSSLLGVVLALGFGFKLFFVFSALGIIGTLLHFPKREDAHAASSNARL